LNPQGSPPQESFTQAQVLGLLNHLDRNKLWFWIRSKKLFGDHDPKRFTQQHLEKLVLLDRCYGLSLTPERSQQILENPDLMRHPAIGMLSHVIDALFLVLSRGDERAYWERIAVECRDLLRCERVLVFSADDSSRLVVMGRSGDRSVVNRTFVDESSLEACFPLWLSTILGEAASFVMHGPQLTSAIGANVRSVLAVPLFFHAEEPSAWIIALNKLNRNNVDAASLFDASDRSLLEFVGRWVEASYRTLLLTHYLKDTGALLQGRSDLDSILGGMLRSAMRVTGAYRGDVAWWDNTQQSLVYIAELGGNAEFGLADPIPSRSVTYWVFEHRQRRELPDVSKDDLYYKCNGNTRSEVAIPLVLPNMPTAAGVLNLEFRKENGFSPLDVQAAELLAQQGALHAQTVIARDAVRSIVTSQNEIDEADRQFQADALTMVLRDVERELGFHRGLVYLANYRSATLDLWAATDASPLTNREQWSLRLAETAVATKVFVENHWRHWPDAHQTPYLRADRRERFAIAGPILGMPIRFGSVPVGVLILWGGAGADRPKLEDVAQIEQFTNLAPTTFYSRERERMLLAVEKLINTAADISEPEELVRVLLQTILDIGLDRARVFRCLDPVDASFECLGSLGVDSPGALRGTVIKNCEHVAYMSEGRLVIRRARYFDPSLPEANPDPNAELLLKPTDLPWINAPILLANNLLGYIAADNKATRRKISKVQVDGLSTIARFAGHVLPKN
jgi:GAF domain-containing protein